MLTRRALKGYFLSGCKKERDFQIGVEWEKIGVTKESGQAIRYSGPRGVEAIFRSLIRHYGWKPVWENSHIIALRKKGASITLEPGGQIELSGQKARRLDDNAAELHRHLAEVRAVSEPLGVAWLGLGKQPVSSFPEIEWVPKSRYAIMREKLKRGGPLTHAMMKETASIQISVDYASEADAVQKLRLAMGLAPILSALFANSPLSGGTAGRLLSNRAHIWRHTAPERTGILWETFRPDFNFDRYVDYALSVPLVFIIRNGRWIAARGTFGEFLKKGLEGHRAALADWELHLTTIFTEARLKKYIEIRSIDCQQTALGLAVPALIKGIFYDEAARNRAWRLVAGLTNGERARLLALAPVKGLKTPFKKGQRLEGAAIQLVRLAEQGLDRLTGKKLSGKGESRYLAPLKELLLKKKMNPAMQLLKCLEAGPGERVKAEAIIRCASLVSH